MFEKSNLSFFVVQFLNQKDWDYHHSVDAVSRTQVNQLVKNVRSFGIFN